MQNDVKVSFDNINAFRVDDIAKITLINNIIININNYIKCKVLNFSDYYSHLCSEHKRKQITL